MPFKVEYNKGFTLMELIVVMAIIASLVGLVGPSLFRQYEKMQFQSDSRKLKQIFHKLSNKAFLSGRNIQVTLNKSDCSYSYQDGTGKPIKQSFSHIQFSEQQLTINTNGFVDSNDLYVINQSGEEFALSLSDINSL